MSQQIHWFPGHMKKALIEVENKLKLVDCVIELLDARIPLSSANKVIDNLVQNKAKLVVLTKVDLADENETKKWIKYFENNGFAVIFADLTKNNDIKKIISAAEKLGETKQEKLMKKGLKPQAIRAMVLGIPNVGKSTLINRISGRRAASVQNKPGHTRAQQLIKVSNKFELLDTPGILQSCYENDHQAMMLALTGSINIDILPVEQISKYAFDFMKNKYSSNLISRFPYLQEISDAGEAFINIAKTRGYFTKEDVDTTKAMKVFLNELKNGQIGRVTFERID